MASPNISFETLPSSIRKPGKYFEFNTKLAVRTLPGNLQEMCIIAPKTGEGVLPPGSPMRVYSDAEARALGGPGSLAHLMVRAAILANPYLNLTLLTLEDDAASIAASASVTFSGSATANGVLTINVANSSVKIALEKDNTAAEAASALVDKINAAELPVKATAAAGVLTLTARNKGPCGNAIFISAESTVPGVTFTVTAMSGGQTESSLAPALASIFGYGHEVIAVHSNEQAQLTELRTHLEAVSHALEQRGATGVAGFTGSLAAGSTLAGKINDGRSLLPILPGTASLPCEVAAAFAAVMAGEEDPAKPLNTLALLGIAVPPLPKWLSRQEQETALYNGLTPLEVGPGDKVQIVRAISTYIKDAQGVDDISLLDITTIRTMDYVRKACRERISLRFPREKLSQKTPARVRSELIDVLLKLEELEIIESVRENLAGLIVERDSQDPSRLNAKIPVDVVNGLHIFAGRIDLLL